MSETVDPALFSPAETPILPIASVAPSLFVPQIPGVMWYPTQFEAFDPNFVGELRGFYAHNRWRPIQSRYQGPRPGNPHGGVDIYAPLNTPIVAPISGEMSIPSNSDALGTRVHIQFTFGGVVWKFMLGHFSSIIGGPRSVTKGEIVGYAGCTGNAVGTPEQPQPCLVPNSCGKRSTHVHLALRREIDSKWMNPSLALSWNLRYGNDTRDILCQNL
jgi:murein DD-endopeptidase MepM/ murein hydrolase activator NlpD